MSYTTVLVHVDDSSQAAQRIAIAAAIAARFEGHLIGAALTGVSRFLYQSDVLEADDATLALHMAYLREQAHVALGKFTTQLAAQALPSHEVRLIDDDAGDGISLHARTADLVVLSQLAPEVGGRDLAEYVVLHAGRPVLVVPHAGRFDCVGSRVLVAWDGGREAARALQLALPLLRVADEVRLAVFDNRGDGRSVADAGAADPRPWLARHGVAATMTMHTLPARRAPVWRHDIGEALLALGSASAADLLVMGGFSHSRLRETLLGGVTRTVLESMTIPVLLAH
jgi:nucleotide-binding universal stress UspA family protein